MASVLNPKIDHRPATRVLIIDDSVVARAVLARAVGDHPGFVVAAAMPDVRGALAFLDKASVEIILLDLEMPGTSGLTALPALIAASHGAKVLIVSSLARDGAATTIEALALGAADTLVKPHAGSLAGKFVESLTERLVRLAEAPIGPVHVCGANRALHVDFDIVAIGASTGGIHALSQLLRAVPDGFAQPLLITQHLPASFSPYFAAQVALLANRPCDVATDRMRIRSGRAIVAPGDSHMACVGLGDGGGAIRLTREPALSGCLPSVDPMFAALAAVYGPRLLAIVLSGMGRDGAEGARTVRAAGGNVIVQDQASSVVWGMPGAVARAGLANAILPPDAIGHVIATGRRPA